MKIQRIPNPILCYTSELRLAPLNMKLRLSSKISDDVRRKEIDHYEDLAMYVVYIKHFTVNSFMMDGNLVHLKKEHF